MQLRQTWLAATGLAALVGVGFGVAAMGRANPLTAELSPLAPFAEWTTQSNLIVGITSLLLTLNRRSQSALLRAAFLTGLTAITLTFLVAHTVLGTAPASQISLSVWIHQRICHDIVPVMAVGGWVVLGQRNIFEWRFILFAWVYGVLYDAVTLIRGAYVDWYPYPWLDPRIAGYGVVLRTFLAFSVEYVLIAAIFVAVDRRSQRRALAATAATAQDQSPTRMA